MPLEFSLPPVADRVADLNARFKGHAAISVLSHAMNDPLVGRVALVSSFGAEAVVLLHMVSLIDRTTPVIFADTEMLFPETLTYQQVLADMLGLTDIRRVTPDRGRLLEKDADGILHVFDADACCALRKVEPLKTALQPFDAWITGRKRYQGGQRAALEFFEAEGVDRVKVNPLAKWSPGDTRDYIENNRLPRHPLVKQGFQSIGCAPCTTPVAKGEDPRAGRWRGRDKIECGIHIEGSKVTPLDPAQSAD